MAVLSRVGDLSFPMILVIVLLGGLFGGERGLKAAGMTIIVAALFLLCLHNAQAISNWVQQPTVPAAVSVTTTQAAATQR